MNFQCPKCLWVHAFDPGAHRLPPWCGKCGADVKQDEWKPAAAAPPLAEPTRPAFTADEVTQVTGTGGKPWLNKPVATTEPETPAPLPELRPMPATDPDQEAGYGRAKAGGVILMVVAGLWAGNVWSFAKSAGKAEGRVVVSNDYFNALKDPHARQKEPVNVVRYEAWGKMHELLAPDLEVGTTVPVVYPTDEPARGRLADPMNLYRWPLTLGLTGLGLLGGSLAAAGALSRARRSAYGDSPTE